MVLLIDTNIILDVLLSRSDFVKESSIIWKLCETEQAKGYISTLTYANIMYHEKTNDFRADRRCIPQVKTYF